MSPNHCPRLQLHQGAEVSSRNRKRSDGVHLQVVSQFGVGSIHQWSLAHDFNFCSDFAEFKLKINDFSVSSSERDSGLDVSPKPLPFDGQRIVADGQ